MRGVCVLPLPANHLQQGGCGDGMGIPRFGYHAEVHQAVPVVHWRTNPNREHPDDQRRVLIRDNRSRNLGKYLCYFPITGAQTTPYCAPVVAGGGIFDSASRVFR